MEQELVTLVAVKRAARAKSASEIQYRGALRAAHDAGHSYAEISKAAGVSRQAVRQLLKRSE